MGIEALRKFYPLDERPTLSLLIWTWLTISKKRKIRRERLLTLAKLYCLTKHLATSTRSVEFKEVIAVRIEIRITCPESWVKTIYISRRVGNPSTNMDHLRVLFMKLYNQAPTRLFSHRRCSLSNTINLRTPQQLASWPTLSKRCRHHFRPSSK